jgi:hypothetical protein
MDRRGRLAGADFIRALACLLVLAHHLVLRLDLGKLSPSLRPTFEFFRFGNYGVSLFFVLSGFLLARPFWSALDRGLPPPSLKIDAQPVFCRDIGWRLSSHSASASRFSTFRSTGSSSAVSSPVFS